MSPVASQGPFCCDEAMQLMADVSPVGGPYGLRIYVCPKCGTVAHPGLRATAVTSPLFRSLTSTMLWARCCPSKGPSWAILQPRR